MKKIVRIPYDFLLEMWFLTSYFWRINFFLILSFFIGLQIIFDNS